MANLPSIIPIPVDIAIKGAFQAVAHFIDFAIGNNTLLVFTGFFVPALVLYVLIKDWGKK